MAQRKCSKAGDDRRKINEETLLFHSEGRCRTLNWEEKVRPKICCFLKNLAVNYFTISAYRSANKFSNEHQILGLRRSRKKLHFEMILLSGNFSPKKSFYLGMVEKDLGLFYNFKYFQINLSHFSFQK